MKTEYNKLPPHIGTWHELMQEFEKQGVDSTAKMLIEGKTHTVYSFDIITVKANAYDEIKATESPLTEDEAKLCLSALNYLTPSEEINTTKEKLFQVIRKAEIKRRNQ